MPGLLVEQTIRPVAAADVHDSDSPSLPILYGSGTLLTPRVAPRQFLIGSELHFLGDALRKRRHGTDPSLEGNSSTPSSVPSILK